MALGRLKPRRPTVGSSDWDYAYRGDVDQLLTDDQLLEYTNSLTPGMALDLGCGTGGNSVELARRGWSVVGVDIAVKAIEVARKETDSSFGITYEVGDMTKWKGTHSFDLVLISYALPSAGPGRETAIANAADSMLPGGTLIIGEFDASSMSWGKPGDFASIEGMTRSLAAFDVVRVESVPTKPHVHGGFTSHDQSTPARAVIAVASRV